MKTIGMGALALLALAGAANADILYTSNVETGNRANGGQAGFTAPATADGTRALFDDVPIPASRLSGNTSINVTRVTVGIRRLANAPATGVSVFWSTFTTAATPPDTNLDTPPALVGTQSLDLAPAAITELVTFGDGVNTLFTVDLNTTLIAGFGSFAIGVSLSNPDGANGWRITNGPDANAAGIFWLHDPNHTAGPNTESAFGFGGGVPSTFFIVVEGSPVPTPGCAALLGLGGLVAMRRRR